MNVRLLYPAEIEMLDAVEFYEWGLNPKPQTPKPQALNLEPYDFIVRD